MKKILIVYTKMVVGGSTTSLLSILNNIDYSKYSVDLLLLDREGDLQYLINKNVNILDFNLNENKLVRYLLPSAILDRLKGYFYSKKENNKLLKAQINSIHLAKSMSILDTYYDVAISFLEFWPLRYIVNNVKATKKIGWIHIDPYEAGLKQSFSQKYLEKLDKIVLVSSSCKLNFDKLFPNLKNKSIVIENILDSQIIKRLAQEECSLEVDKQYINLVTVCRINLSSKALERVIYAFSRLRNEGIEVEKKIRWYVIGDGPDYDKFYNLIVSEGLNNIFLLGKKLNPYKYEVQMDCFILPSKYEGKPMAVTEAQMLGVVPIVCNYSSAQEQIKHNRDGFIAENSDIGIYIPLKLLCENKLDYVKFKQNLISNDFSNLFIMNKINRLLEE